MTPVRPLVTNLKMTVRADCAVSACSPLLLSIKSLAPLVVNGRSQPLDRCSPFPSFSPVCWNKANFPFHQPGLFISFGAAGSQNSSLLVTEGQYHGDSPGLYGFFLCSLNETSSRVTCLILTSFLINNFWIFSLTHSWILRRKCHYLVNMIEKISSVQVSSVVQSCLTLCNIMICSTPGLPVHHQLLSSLKLMSTESVMQSSHLILCRSLLLLPPIPPSIRVFSNESTLHMRWPKY